MCTQSAAFLSDEGFPALRVFSGCDPRTLRRLRIHEHALLKDRTGNTHPGIAVTRWDQPRGRGAAAVSQAVYNEKGADPGYWYKYFQGTQEKDKKGIVVDLGGSAVANLADNLRVFGLAPGSVNAFAA